MKLSFDAYDIVPLDPANSHAFFTMVETNRPRLADFFAGTVAQTPTLEATEEYCRQMVERIREKSYFPFAIIAQSSGQMVGLFDVKNMDWRVPKAELGCFVDAGVESTGIATQALGLMVPWLVETHGFKKLLCRINEGNAGSVKVALKNGFELEGTVRNDYRTTKGEIVDLNYYGRIF